MKKNLKTVGIIAVLCCIFASFAVLTACGGGENKGDDKKPQKTVYTVTFDSNGGSEVASQQVEEGAYAVKPQTDPTKAENIFECWCKDQALQTPFEFETEAITANITLYASWTSSANSAVAKFHWNYTGADPEVYDTKTFGNGGRISAPTDPTRSGYYFGGWYTEDGTQYKKTTKYTGNQDFYAKWQKIFTFEAEKTQLTGLTDDFDAGLANESGDKKGHNFSGDRFGVNLIQSDAGASSGKYVSGLFYRGAYLEFEITSDKATTGAVLKAKFSCEYADITLTTKTFNIYVNNKKVTFGEIKLGSGQAQSTNPGPRGGFKEIYISDIDLVAGKNTIKLEVNNNERPAGDAGTVGASAPAIDCIIIYAESELTMTEYQNS